MTSQLRVNQLRARKPISPTSTTSPTQTTGQRFSFVQNVTGQGQVIDVRIY